MQRPDDLAEAVDTVTLMQEAVGAAGEDAGPGDALLRGLDLVAVVDGAWKYSDPGRLVADAVGATEATTMLSYSGGNTPQSLVNGIAERIQSGDISSAVIAGGETIWSRRRRRSAGLPSNSVVQADAEPNERFKTDIPMSTDFEKARGLDMPVNCYPIFESAVRAANGESLDAHRDRVSELWAGFNAVAAANPYSWFRTPMSASDIREPSPSNRMVGFPYTKAMNSNWDLDQAAALIICSVETAEAAGIDRSRWVFPHAGTDAHDTYAVSERRDLHSSPAIEAAGRRLFELTGLGPEDLDHIDLYSCFPSAVQVGAASLGIPLDRQLTVTGGLTFAGGPLNNYVTHSIATMVDVLRNDPGSIGLVTANGGYLTKHALGIYSTEPGATPFVAEDVQEQVNEVPTTDVDETFAGVGEIEAYTVMHGKEGPERALAAVRTPAGARTWASSTASAIMTELLTVEGIGRSVEVNHDGEFELC